MFSGIVSLAVAKEVATAQADIQAVAGMSRDDILGFYAKIEELNSLLAAR